MYGTNAGEALGESNLGSLEVGSIGDLLVVEARSLEEALRTGARAVRETWVDGVCVFDSAAVGRGPNG